MKVRHNAKARQSSKGGSHKPLKKQNPATSPSYGDDEGMMDLDHQHGYDQNQEDITHKDPKMDVDGKEDNGADDLDYSA
jgi:hypothetical protein